MCVFCVFWISAAFPRFWRYLSGYWWGGLSQGWCEKNVCPLSALLFGGPLKTTWHPIDVKNINHHKSIIIENFIIYYIYMHMYIISCIVLWIFCSRTLWRIPWYLNFCNKRVCWIRFPAFFDSNTQTAFQTNEKKDRTTLRSWNLTWNEPWVFLGFGWVVTKKNHQNALLGSGTFALCLTSTAIITHRNALKLPSFGRKKSQNEALWCLQQT